jgi:hypothetical protein
MLVCFFGLSPGFECKQSIWAPGMETLLSFYSKNQMKIELRTGIGQLWKIKHFAPMELVILLVGGY